MSPVWMAQSRPDFNLHTFRPWQYRRIWREMPLLHIGPTSRDTRSMVHLSESGLKNGTRAVTVRHRAKRRRGGITLTAFGRDIRSVCRKKPEIRRVLRLNQRILLSDAGKCLKTVGLGEISLSGGISFSGMKVIQKTEASSITNSGIATRYFLNISSILEAPGGRILHIKKAGCRQATHE